MSLVLTVLFLVNFVVMIEHFHNNNNNNYYYYYFDYEDDDNSDNDNNNSFYYDNPKPTSNRSLQNFSLNVIFGQMRIS